MSFVVATLTRIDDVSSSPLGKSTSDIVKNLPSEVYLKHGRYVLGRGKAADIAMSIRVDKKEIISRAHSEIVCSSNNLLYISDLNSVNGVFVNGLRIENQVLYDGDIVQIGGMAKMPTGKKLKQSAENVQYRLQYKVKIPDELRVSAPPLTPSADTKGYGGSAIIDDQIIQDNPFEVGTTPEKGVVSVTISSKAVKAAKGNYKHTQASTSKKRPREKSDASSATSSRIDKDPHGGHQKILHRKQQCISVENDCQRNNSMRDTEEWMERLRCKEAELHEAKLQGEQKLMQLRRCEQKLEERDEMNNTLLKAMDALKKKQSDSWQMQTTKLLKEHCAERKDRERMWEERLSTIKNGYCKENEQQKQQHIEAMAKHNRHLEEKIAKIAELQAHHSEEVERLNAVIVGEQEKVQLQNQNYCKMQEKYDKEMQEKDALHVQVAQAKEEVWVEKMNALLQTSAEDLRTYKTQVAQLRQQCDMDRRASLPSATSTSATTATCEPGATVVAEEAACSIGVDALREHIMCALCQQPMMDAVVCRCSHGFCQVCLEKYIHKEEGKSNAKASKYIIHKTLAAIKSDKVDAEPNMAAPKPSSLFSCPVCQHGDDDLGQDPFSKNRGAVPYFRSEHLDSIVYLVHQASSLADRVAFEQRESANFSLLKALGVDPIASVFENFSNPESSTRVDGNTDTTQPPATTFTARSTSLRSGGVDGSFDSENDSASYGNYNSGGENSECEE